MFTSIAAISTGATIGALLRWWLAGLLNPLWPAIPLGTLAANLVGGYAIGLAVGFFGQNPQVPAEARLFVITGLLGALTTFSTFSAEVVTHLEQGRPAWALATGFTHLAGSLLLTALGLATVQWLSGS